MISVLRASGSYVVIYINMELYIDARKDVRYPEHTFVEVVLNGMVVYRTTILNINAPKSLIEMMNYLNRGGSPRYYADIFYRERIE